MLEILPLSPDLLAELGRELGGRDFTDQNQMEFLAEVSSCDVQAAPGNGKTTLLAAKIALLSRNWSSRKSGVCVISHTNAARTEVEELISRHPTAARLMRYPHFTGTVTAWIHQYLALPYLRGLGWRVRQIDDDAFEAEALRRYPSFWALKNQAMRAETTVKNWVSRLDLDPNFEDSGAEPGSLLVRRQKGQHGHDTDCGKALESLKASMVRDGFYRYADMNAIAWRALQETQGLAERLRGRFPLVILDESQDTHGDQLKLLEKIFNHPQAAFQRLGDSNQTLYEDSGVLPTYWTPDASCIPLDSSRRFGTEIAKFSSRLTARRAQNIVGLGTQTGVRVMFLFDEATIGKVLGKFADEAQALWGAECSVREAWVVASRHSVAGKKGAWQPQSLVDYHPAYRSESGSRAKAHLLCRQLQKAAVQHAAARPPSEVCEMLAAGIVGLARAYGWKTARERPITTQNVWAALALRNSELARAVRRLLRDYVLVGNAAWDMAEWTDFLEKLLPLFDPNPPVKEVTDYCVFVAAKKSEHAGFERQSAKQAKFGNLTLQLGSIHAVKGKSVDGILVVESEVWKGARADEKCIDLSTVLPHAFGVRSETFAGVKLTAATNVFVGVTRSRELLGLALRKSMAEALIEPAILQGWKVVDLSDQSRS